MDLDFDQITDDLFIGARLGPHDWHVMQALHVTVDLNLQAEAHDRFLAASPEVYMWLPVADYYGPTLDKLMTGAPFIALMISQGRKVYVHCHAGLGRTPIMAAGYLVVAGMSAEDALKLIGRKRPRINPTDGQIQHLFEFEARWNQAPIKTPE
ncbi:MAG: phosphatase [Chloroflexi bacterium]|nr:phosphatase [Chloroflexota bacterium]